jgi:hypothetical protein
VRLPILYNGVLDDDSMKIKKHFFDQLFCDYNV